MTLPGHNQSGYSLHTLGDLALRGAVDVPRGRLRKKDLALLAFLCADGARAHSRVLLSSLLWGDRTQVRARHSLTQAVGRLRAVLGADALVARSEQIEWRETAVMCDVCVLERVFTGEQTLPSRFTYGGDFLVNFRDVPGAQEFEAWAEQRRTRYRAMALHVFEQQGMEAEARGHWAEALELGRRTAQIEALYEEGHRRVMRSWAALGERGLALRHYEEFTLWLRDEVDLQPDPATSKLAFDLRNAMLADAGEARAPEVAGSGRSSAIDERDVRNAGSGNVSSHRRDDAGRASPYRSVWTRLRRAVQWRSAEWRDD